MVTADDTVASTVADTSITTTATATTTSTSTDFSATTPTITEVQSPTITVTPAPDNNNNSSSISSNDKSNNSNGDEDSLEMTDIDLIRTLFSPHRKQQHHQDQFQAEEKEEEEEEMVAEHGKIESVQLRPHVHEHHHVELEEEEEHNLSLSPFSRTKLLQSGPNTPALQHMFSSSLFRSPPLTSISSGSSASRLFHLDHSRGGGDDEENDDDVSLLYTETVRRTLERKERVILDLQSQLTLLQQDREQDAEKHRREMALMRSQMAHREEEMTRMRRQLLEMQHKHEMQLEQAGRAHEEVLAEERQMNTERTTALRDRLQQLTQELEQQKRRDKEHQLQMHRSQQQAELQTEEHKREQQEKQQAHEQLLATLEQQYTEQLEGETMRLQREHAQRMRDQADTLHEEQQQQRQKAESEHRAQISQLEERIHELQMRTSILPELERQAAQHTLLKQEHSSTKQRLHVITQQMQQLEQQMHHSQEQSEQMEEMTAHMAQHNALLQQQLDKARQRAAQLEERTHNVELLQGELAHLKGTVLPEQKARYDGLSQKMRAQQDSTRDKFSRLSRDLHTILSMMMMVTTNSDRIRDEEHDENESESENHEDRQSTDASLISLDESALFDPSDTPLFILLDNEDNGINRNDVDVDDQNSIDYEPSGDDEGRHIHPGANSNTVNNSNSSSSLVYQLYHQTRYLVTDISSLRQHLRRLDSEHTTTEQARLSSESVAQALQEQLVEQRGQCSDYQRTILHLEDQAAQLQQTVENARAETRDALSQLQRQHHTVQHFHTLVMRLLKNDTSDAEEDGDSATAVSAVNKKIHFHPHPEEEGDEDESKNNNTFESLIHEMTSLVQRHHRLYKECLRRGKILGEQLRDTQKQLENTRHQLHSAREGMERQRAEQERLRLEVLEQQSQTHEQQMDSTVRQHTQQLQKLDQRYSELQSAARDLSLRHRKLSMSHELLEREVRELSDERHALVNGIRLLVRGIRPMRQHIQDLRMQKHLLSDMCHRTQEQLHQLHRTVDKYCNRVLPQQQGDANSHHRISLRAVVIAVLAHNRMLRLVRSCGGRDHDNPNQGAAVAATVSLQHGQERIHLLSMGHDSSLQRHMQHDTVPLHLLTDDVVRSDDPHTVVPCFLQLCSLFDPRTTQQIMSGSIGIVNRDDGDGGHDGGISGTLMMHALRQGLQRMRSLIGSSGTGRGGKNRGNMEDPTRRARHRLRAWRQYCTDLQHRHTQQQRRVGELQREMEQVNSSHTDVVQLLERRGQLVEYMEDRIRTLEAEGLRTVPTEKHTKLYNDLTETRRQMDVMKRELTDAKRLSSKWSSELEEASAKLRRQQRRISELEDDVKTCKEVELVEATAQLRRERDRTVKLQQENRKFRFLVQEMQSRLFIENGSDRTEQDEAVAPQVEEESTFNGRLQHLDTTDSAVHVQDRKKETEQTRVSDLLVEEIERDIEMARAELLELKNAQPHTY